MTILRWEMGGGLSSQGEYYGGDELGRAVIGYVPLREKARADRQGRDG